MNELEKCRRTRRDRAAGLVFRWRVSRGSFWRTLLAVTLTAGVFAGAASLFQVRELAVVRQPRESYALTILDPGHEGSRAELEWVRRNSPFLDRWEPDVESRAEAQLAAMEAELVARTRYQPLLLRAPEITKVIPLPELFDPSRPRLPEVSREMGRVVAPPAVEVRVFAEATGALKERWRSSELLLGELLTEREPKERPEEYLGLERRFLIGLDAAGSVVFCRALSSKTERDLDQELAGWLRMQRCEPAGLGAGEERGEIQVTIRGIPLEKEAP